MSAKDKIIAVIGAGIAGSEAAFQFAQRGIPVVIFEQNALPYGKIEEGLPKWHVNLRNKEEEKIDQKLQHPLIRFVPKTRLGRDFHLTDLPEWGFSAVLLAVGAWRDRPLPVPGIEAFRGKGLIYQNELLAWFNHYHEPDYRGPRFQITDGAVVIGGGLASLDVVKILQLETTRQALAERGYSSDILTLEREGIPAVLQSLGLRWQDLGLNGCTLYYRRRIEDMPLAPISPKADHARRERMYQLRRRILKNYQDKYLFQVREQSVPVDIVVKDGHLAGLVMQHTEVTDGGVRLVPDKTFTVETQLVISSIGSVPEPLREIRMEGELLAIEDAASGKLRGFGNVFALGNAVTGKGNIRESYTHGKKVAKYVYQEHLSPEEEVTGGYAHIREENSRIQVNRISELISGQPAVTAEARERLDEKIRELQQAAGYKGDYSRWIEAHRPARLEEMSRISGQTAEHC